MGIEVSSIKNPSKLIHHKTRRCRQPQWTRPSRHDRSGVLATCFRRQRPQRGRIAHHFLRRRGLWHLQEVLLPSLHCELQKHLVAAFHQHLFGALCRVHLQNGVSGAQLPGTRLMIK
eukprot:s2836_g7.t1